MNSAELVDCFRIMRAAYPHLTIEDDQLELWANALQSDRASDVMPALAAWIDDPDHGTFPPTIANLRNKMREIASARRRDQEMAWTGRPDPMEGVVDFERGRAVAADAYANDCARRGVEPHWDWWNKAMAVFGPSPENQQRRQARNYR